MPESGIYITRVNPDGLAYQDGQIAPGDQLMQVSLLQLMPVSVSPDRFSIHLSDSFTITLCRFSLIHSIQQFPLLSMPSYRSSTDNSIFYS